MNNQARFIQRQHGIALIIFTLTLVLAAIAYFLTQMNSNTVKLAREKTSISALAEAKSALIGKVIGDPNITTSFYFPNPELSLNVPTFPEGSETGVAGSQDRIIIGKLPWNSLDIGPIKDGTDECLWYVLSGRFKNNPKTTVLNWDTQAQIDVIDANGNSVATNVVALIVSAGAQLTGQNRSVTTNTQCGGDSDVMNFMDTPNSVNAVAGQVNYFAGTPNHREATDVNNKQFVRAKNDYYNDQFVFVTVDDIFKPIIRRTDFKSQINTLLNMAQLSTVSISGVNTKGADNIDCNLITNANDKRFCENWKEMLLLIALPSMPIYLDGTATATCNRVIIFGGQKTSGQVRLTAADKNNPANYLEANNLLAFNAPATNTFYGVSNFDPDNPSADVMRCI